MTACCLAGSGAPAKEWHGVIAHLDVGMHGGCGDGGTRGNHSGGSFREGCALGWVKRYVSWREMKDLV